LPELTYETMQTIAGAGARVLNADAVEFAKRAGIVVLARRAGEDSGRQTVVASEAREPPGVVAVVHAASVTHLRGNAEPAGLLAQVHRSNGRVIAARFSPAVDLLVDRTGIPGKSPESLERLAAAAGLDACEVEVVTLVGTGLVTREDCLAVIAELVPAAAWSANANAIHVVVPVGAGADATRALHQRLVAN
jgi:aspartate kinase